MKVTMQLYAYGLISLCIRRLRSSFISVKHVLRTEGVE